MAKLKNIACAHHDWNLTRQLYFSSVNVVISRLIILQALIFSPYDCHYMYAHFREVI